MAKKQKKPSLEDLINELVEYSEHFKDVYENGCSDPFYADGLNLNLIRNHIIYRKRMIEEHCSETGEPIPDEYRSIETPREVPGEYMARSAAIRGNAKNALVRLQPYYEELRSYENRIDARAKEEISFYNVLGYYLHLVKAIETDDLVTMRRYKEFYGKERTDSYIEAFTQCIDKAKMRIKDQLRFF